MKKSNLLLTLAALLLLFSLGAYNMSLKAEYLRGSHKDPFRDFKALNLSGFEAIDNNAASKVQVKVRPGKFQVWVLERSQEFVKVKLVGNRLQIDADFPENLGFNEKVIVTCPSLKEIKTNSFYLWRGKKTVSNQDYNYDPMLVEGFSLDSLTLTMENSSAIKLVKNKIGTLRSHVGLAPGADSKLEIGPDNTIQDAFLHVDHKGRLVLNGPAISRLHPKFGDSTAITFSGSALGFLKK